MLQALRMPQHQDLGMLRASGMVNKSLGSRDAAGSEDARALGFRDAASPGIEN